MSHDLGNNESAHALTWLGAVPYPQNIEQKIKFEMSYELFYKLLYIQKKSFTNTTNISKLKLIKTHWFYLYIPG